MGDGLWGDEMRRNLIGRAEPEVCELENSEVVEQKLLGVR